MATITDALARERTAWEDLEMLQGKEGARLDAARVAHEARKNTIRHFLAALDVTPKLSATAHAALVIAHVGSAMQLAITQYTPVMSLRTADIDTFPDGQPFFRLVDNHAILLVDIVWTYNACALLHAALCHLWQRYAIPRKNIAELKVAMYFAVPQISKLTTWRDTKKAACFEAVYIHC